MTPEEAVARLADARHSRRTLTRFTDAQPELDEAWGYAVQALDEARRLASGEVPAGAKLGLTSAAKQQRMQVDRPIVGFLTDAMVIDQDDVADRLATWAQPRIEPEIAFVTSRPVDGPLARDQVLDVVGEVTVAAEILDSRYTGYRFGLPDVVADNTSAAALVLSRHRVRPDDLPDLGRLRCTLSVDDEVVDEATGAAILGDPLEALVLLSEHLGRYGRTLPAGSIVLAGAMTDAVPLLAGHRVSVQVEELGRLDVAP